MHIGLIVNGNPNSTRIATHCNTLQHTATRCNTLQLAATRCNTLQHTLQHTRRHHVRAQPRVQVRHVIAPHYQRPQRHTHATHCNTLPHTATRYNSLQHTATHCNTHCNIHIGITFALNRKYESNTSPRLTISGLNGTLTATSQPYTVNADRFTDFWRTDGVLHCMLQCVLQCVAVCFSSNHCL